MSKENGTKRIALVASKGTMDMAYPPLILASTAVSMDWEGAIFFTLYGLDIIKKSKLEHMKVAALGNPAAPVPVPSIIGALPGMTAMATMMMKSWIKKANVATVPELVDVCREGGIHLYGCQMTRGAGVWHICVQLKRVREQWAPTVLSTFS